MVRVQEAMALILSTHQESFFSLQPWARTLIGLFVLCWLSGDNADDDNEEKEKDKNENDDDDDGDKDIARQSSEITKQATAVDATPTKQQQGYFMQPPTNTAYIFFVTMIKLIKTRILMQPPVNTAQTCAGGDD